MTTNDFIQKAVSIHGDKYDYSYVNYINAKTKVKIICPIHGLFEQTPNNHLYGKCGCPICAGNRKSDLSDFIRKARMVHGDQYDYSKSVYVNSKTPLAIICKKHGSFLQSPVNHLSGKGCPKCAGNVRLMTDEFIQRAISVHGDRYDYSNVIYENNRTPVSIICPIHGVFEQKPYVHLQGCGCPVCGFVQCHENRDSEAAFEHAKVTFLRKYGVSNPMYDFEIRNKHKKIVQSDDVNNKRIQTKREHHSFNTSLPEYRLGKLLESVFGRDDVCRHYKSDEYPFLCDFYIKSRQLYIELNAHWTHGCHWFNDDNLEDLEKLSIWKSKGYVIDTWTVRDVKKREIAKQNHLKYVVFWKCDLSDAKQWISMNCPDGYDWIKEYSWL